MAVISNASFIWQKDDLNDLCGADWVSLKYEGNAFSFTGNVKEDLLSIASAHPMKKEAVSEFLKKANRDWAVIDRPIAEGKLTETEYKNNKFYVRKI